MGYLVDVHGRLLLPADVEATAVPELRRRLLAAQGWLSEDWRTADLAELAGFAATRVERDGDWLRLFPDEDGDPKWSEQASVFFLGLGDWVRDGEVRVEGEDGERWGYRYAADGVRQLGTNGWDGTPGHLPAARAPGRPGWEAEAEPLGTPPASAADSFRPASRRAVAVLGIVAVLAGLVTVGGSALAWLGTLAAPVALRLAHRGRPGGRTAAGFGLTVGGVVTLASAAALDRVGTRTVMAAGPGDGSGPVVGIVVLGVLLVGVGVGLTSYGLDRDRDLPRRSGLALRAALAAGGLLSLLGGAFGALALLPLGAMALLAAL